MRPAVLTSSFVVLAVAGCSSSPSPGSRPVIEVSVPASDPYAVPHEGDFPPVAEIHAPLPAAGVLNARHLAQVAALSTVVLVTLDRGTSLITGPERAAEVAALFLADRARFEHQRVRVSVYQVNVAPDALVFEALTRCLGGLYAHVPAHVAADLLGAPRRLTASFVVHDAETVDESSVAQRMRIPGRVQEVDADGPYLDIHSSGPRLSATAWLAGRGDLLVLDWRQQATRANVAHDAQVLVRDQAGFTSVPEVLVRLYDIRFDARVVLRLGEALLLVQAPPDQDDLLLTIVTWRRDAIP